VQSFLWAVVVRLQLCSQAVQASFKLSFARPGRSLQEAKTHLLLALTMLDASAGVTLGGVAAILGCPRLGAEVVTGGAPHAIIRRDKEIAKLPTMHEPRSFFMGLILLEALLALLLLLLIVWWTMFSGRKKGELVSEEETKTNKQKDGEKP
jgi:hypothetical protein